MGVQAQHATVDPTLGIRTLKPPSNGFHVWTEEEITKFEARWPIGTKLRWAFDLLLHTGLRRGDVVRLSRQHVKDGVATIRTENIGQVVYLSIPPRLAHTIENSKTGDLAFIVSEYGRPIGQDRLRQLVSSGMHRGRCYRDCSRVTQDRRDAGGGERRGGG